MKRRLFILTAFLLVSAGVAADSTISKPAIITFLHGTAQTLSGQPITLPPEAEIHASVYSLKSGQKLPTHKHTHQRLTYILEGAIDVVDVQKDMPKTRSFKAGDFMTEMRDQWHYGVNPLKRDATLLVMDIVPPGTKHNVTLQNKVAVKVPITYNQIFKTTNANQPIVVTTTPEIRATIYEIPAKSGFPVHQHPYLRMFYVLSGAVDVIDVQSHEIQKVKAGEFVVESLNRQHYGENNHDTPVRVLVIDIVPVGDANNTVLANTTD